MRTVLIASVSLAFGVGALVATVARSQEQKPTTAPAAGTAAAGGAKQPSPEEMMAKWMELGTPGEEHERLKPMVGKFTAEVSMQMSPDAPPMTSKGTLDQEMILNGRYLKGDYTGDFMGKPFKGISLLAYDKMKKKYVNTWMDDMSTMMMIAEGTADSAGKTITLTSDCQDPMTGQPKKMRQVVTIVDNDHHTVEMYESGSEGKEFKAMSIKYTRAK